MKKDSPIRKHLTLRYVALVGVLLLVADILLGAVLLNRSKGVMHTLIAKNMNDIADCAAGMMDGDAMRDMTAADVGGPAYNEAMKTLDIFQKKVDIIYIYALRKEADGVFTFTVDPDPVEPAAFGERSVVSPALISAGNGVSAVDDEAHEDRWGNYYSAYSPFFDSNGNQAGIIGVDFDIEWYHGQIRRYTVTISVISILTVLVGILFMYLIMRRLSNRFVKLEEELTQLSRELDSLGGSIAASGRVLSGEADGPAFRPYASVDDPDEIEQLNNKVRTMQNDIAGYLNDLRVQALTDGLTGIGNSAAYHEMEKELDEAIRKGDASFALTIFDLNDLKGVNDTYGHSTGDNVIRNAARILSVVFGKNRTFRIGGDEFAVVTENTNEAQLAEYIKIYEHGLDSYNAAKPEREPAVQMARGTAFFRPGVDTSFLEVFKRADEEMYVSKARFYTGEKDRHHRDS